MLVTIMAARQNQSKWKSNYSEASRRMGIRTQERSTLATFGLRRLGIRTQERWLDDSAVSSRRKEKG